jgi:hypothetical protein
LIPILDHSDESLLASRAEVRTLKDSFFQILSTKKFNIDYWFHKHINTCNSDKCLTLTCSVTMPLLKPQKFDNGSPTKPIARPLFGKGEKGF